MTRALKFNKVAIIAGSCAAGLGIVVIIGIVIIIISGRFLYIKTCREYISEYMLCNNIHMQLAN